MSNECLLVFSTVGSEQEARRIAAELVEAQVVACVNILPPVTSVFRWEPGEGDAAGAAVQEEREVMLLMKSTTGAYARLERTLRATHPYELPEIIAVPVSRGLPEFLQWIDETTHS